jgi:hypothetical protein
VITDEGEPPLLDAIWTLAYLFKCSPFEFYDLTFDEIEDATRRTERLMKSLQKRRRELET